MSDTEQFLQDARRCFLFAGNALDAAEMERCTTLAREFLLLAHDASKIELVPKRADDKNSELEKGLARYAK